ncbi:glycosyltransferase [Photobacterium japonica]|uniref:MJ1255/VC2487 family glycosyltransferase n=1 Tax=Photobacterium japonica TaxID=2910235 RepID=UPI003D13EBCB
MKILYGVQGTGNGHISRAREMARAFTALGMEVDYLFTGRASSQYFDMACFGDYRAWEGLSFISEHGQINQWKTFRHNRPIHFLQDVSRLDVSGYDLVLNDFEPVSAWAAQRQRVPSIGVSHQNAFLYDVPTLGQSWLDTLITRHFAPTQHALGLHWFHFNQKILPPIVPPTQTDSFKHTLPSLSLGREHSPAVLVYLPFEDLALVLTWLSRFSSVTFECYHPAVAADREEGNVRLRRLDRQGFHAAMHRCAGVIANGGFELPSEAISLGKKLLLKPLQGQYEQQSNVMTLEMMGLAQSMSYLDSAALMRWLSSESVGQVQFPDVAMAIAQWVQQGEWGNHDTLWRHLWQQVEFPDVTHEALADFSHGTTPSRRSAIMTL